MQMFEEYAIIEPKTITARCRTSSGMVNDIDVLDLSVAGCLVNKRLMRLVPEERVLIKLHGLGFLPANVVWTEDERAGLEFEEPLYEPVVDHLLRGLAA